MLLAGNEQKVSLAITNIESNFEKILSYYFLCTTIAMILGFLAKFFVRKKGWDRKYKLFRFQNEWHYFFTGEALSFPRVPGHYEKNHFSFLDVLVETSEGPIIYSGILADYVLDSKNGVNRVTLLNTHRRFLKLDLEGDAGKNKNKHYNLPGRLFTIPFENILNIQFDFYSVKTDTD